MPTSRTPSPMDYQYQDEEHEQEQEASRTPPHKVTRTVAIIKNHALTHRFDIEPRILQADFEIVKERQMEFDTETDPDTLYELFGEDAECFSEGPVWVYVLERRRAVEVWNTLMGDRDPTVACTTTPTSLRALYGLSRAQNALMGSPDTHTAEIQIASLFASSPLYPMHDLPTDLSSSSQFLSTSSAAMSSSQRTPGRYSTPSVTSTTSPGHATRLNSTGKPVTRFRARPLPATTIVPSIAPRTTKAAALRAGTLDPATLDAAAKGPKVAPTREQQVLAFMDVPGHKRSSTIPVASTAAPAIAPRMTKAAALRLGIEPPPRRVRHSMGGAGAGAEGVFEGVPGHKRRESIAVLSTRPPAVGPRLNRSAALRAEKDKAPPTSFQFKTPVARAPSRAGSISGSRPPSSQSVRAPAMARTPSAPTPASAPIVAPPLRRRPSSLAAPTIAPRPNRSAQLRAAKMEATNASVALKKPAPRGLVV